MSLDCKKLICRPKCYFMKLSWLFTLGLFFDLNESFGSFEMRLDMFDVKVKGFHFLSAVYVFFPAKLCG